MNGIPIKLPMAFFTKLGQNIFKVSMETQKASNSQRNLEKGKWSWRNQAPSFRLYYKQSYSNQDSTVLAQKQKHRSMGQDVHSIYTESIQGQWKNTESPQVNLHNYGHLIYDKRSNIQWGKKSLFNKWCC